MNEVIAYNSPHPCSYLPERTALLPLRFQRQQVTAEELDACLAAGDRRTGRFLYRTHCPECQACEPIRLDLDTFRPNETQRREWRKGNELLEVKIGQPVVDEERVRLFNLHQRGRRLKESDDDLVDAEGYQQFLTSSCCRTLEFAYYHQQELVAVAIADVGTTSLSAVYCYFDPQFHCVSLGTYSVLRQAEYCRQKQHRYLYLGFYIAESPHMSYKAKFHPHQRLIGGAWRDFD
ncbi:MAG: arginyltransferase [Planctomycetales bacterium]|nr:arginyltransferase [Planctomycetales bacterium]